MAKDPAFLFYPGDWLGGTMGYSRHEKGAYIDLLMCQFNNGHMDSHMVLTILGEKDYNELWENKLKRKFKIDSDGKFYNEKLEYEMVRRKNYTDSRKKNLSHMASHMETHMGVHMENGNGNRIKNKKGGMGENKKMRGIKFSDDLLSVIFEDGSMQYLGESQKYMLSQGQLFAKDIVKENIY